MNFGWKLFRRAYAGVLAFLLSTAALPVLATADDTMVVAVSGRASDDYIRTKHSDGSFEPESYAFGQGGRWKGTVADESIDHLKFLDVARGIAEPLARQNYLPANDPQKATLLIMVYWGTTSSVTKASGSVAYQSLAESQTASLPPAPSQPAGDIRKSAQSISDIKLITVLLENEARDRLNARNAGILGYDATGLIGTDYGRGLQVTALRWRWQDMVDEVEDSRYFVVLMAYDFQLLWKERKAKLLWETRYSIRQRRNEFDRQLVAMTNFASQYFGQDSHGLVRKEIPEGRVTIGDLKVLGASSDER